MGKPFSDVFELNKDRIRFADNLNVQRRVQVIRNSDESQSIRFAGAGLEALGEDYGSGLSSTQVLAYVGLNLRNDINNRIQEQRSNDEHGLHNVDNFNVDLNFSADANVDSVVWSDQYSLRDLGGQYALMNPDLEIVARAAKAKLTSDGSFDLGTKRETTKSGDVEYTNLVRKGDTIMQTNTWRNDSEF